MGHCRSRDCHCDWKFEGAGMGVAMKVTMMTGMICIGFGHGVQPLLDYCVGAKLWERFKKIMKFSIFFSLRLSAVMTGLCYLFRDSIIRVFYGSGVFSIRAHLHQYSADHQLPVRRILCADQCFAGHGRGNAGSHHQPQPSGDDLYSLLVYSPVRFTGKGPRLGTAVADLLSTALVVLLYL